MNMAHSMNSLIGNEYLTVLVIRPYTKAVIILYAIQITTCDPYFTCAQTQGQLAGSNKPGTRDTSVSSPRL